MELDATDVELIFLHLTFLWIKVALSYLGLNQL